MALSIARVDWFDPRGVALRAAMDAEMSALYAGFMAAHTPEVREAIDDALAINPADVVVGVIALDGDRAVAHAVLRAFRDDRGPFGDELEVKKVFVDEGARGKGVARALMAWLDDYARSAGIGSLVLQTGSLQPEAIALYEKIGYVAIEPYRGYGAIPGGLCYRKVLATA